MKNRPQKIFENSFCNMNMKMNTEPSTQTNGQPIWVRAPKSGNEFYTGLSRSKLYELAAAGKIVTASIRNEEEMKGTRLFKLQSILDFLETQILPPQAIADDV